MNTREMIREAARELREAGVPDPEYDSAALLSRVTGLPPLVLRIGAEKEPTTEQTEAFREMIRRRKDREPLQYIEGKAWFARREFTVGPGALIPRPETALLAEWAEEWLKNRREAGLRRKESGGGDASGDGEAPDAEVLDLCCGSGCLGITLRKDCPGIRCTMTDISPEALEIARENDRSHRTGCEILQGDLFSPVTGRRFDLILSNPPYIPTEECGGLQPEVLREPGIALDGGADGMDFYRRIAEEAKSHLKAGGALLLEAGIREAGPIEALLRAQGAEYTEIRKDFSGIDRMVLAEFGETDDSVVERREQCLKNCGP